MMPVCRGILRGDAREPCIAFDDDFVLNLLMPWCGAGHNNRATDLRCDLDSVACHCTDWMQGPEDARAVLQVSCFALDHA